MSARANQAPATLILGLISVTWAILVGVMFFGTGSGEHDTFRMAAGIVHGATVGQVINPVNYSNDLQFGFYYLFHYAAKFLSLDGPHVLLAMNIVGASCALAIPVLLYYILRLEVTSATFSGVAVVLLISSPAYAFLVPYGHPFHIAFALSLSSILLFRRYIRTLPHARYILFVGAILLQAIALAIRAEQVFLFWFCVIGLLIYENNRSKKEWTLLFVLLASAATLFFVAHDIIVPPVQAESVALSTSTDSSSIGIAVGAFLLTYKIYLSSDFVRAMAYHISDIGLPILAITSFFIWKQISQKNFRLIIALLISVGPSLLVYFPNTSPPRHFIITAVALTIYAAASAKTIKRNLLIPAAMAFFAVNVAAPQLLGFILNEENPRNVTYSFFQRYDRNQHQTEAAMQVFPVLLSRLPSETVIFGEWIHLAQISMLMSTDSSFELSSANLAPDVKGSVILYRGRKLYLVERYTEEDAQHAFPRIKADHPNIHYFSLLSEKSPNLLEIELPAELRWWSV